METIQTIFVDQISDPATAMRSGLDRDELFNLADNIKQNGLINPITVRPLHKKISGASGDNSERIITDASNNTFSYEVVAGHRRLSACKIAGLIKISCVVRELDDNKTFEVMAAENLERADVDPVEESNFLLKYMEQTNKTIPEVAKSIRRSVSYVESRISVAQMPDYIKDALKDKTLKLGCALSLMRIDKEQTRRVYIEMAIRDGISVAQADYWVHTYEMSKLPGGEIADTPATDYVAGAPQVVKFECAIDGIKYDSRLVRTLMVYEGNLDIFNAFVSAFRNSPPAAENAFGVGGE